MKQTRECPRRKGLDRSNREMPLSAIGPWPGAIPVSHRGPALSFFLKAGDSYKITQ